MPTTAKPPRPRHDQFIWKQADNIVSQMETKGLALHMDHRWYGTNWFLSNGQRVDPEIAEAVTKDPRIVPVGDSLFPNLARSQTWRFAPRR